MSSLKPGGIPQPQPTIDSLLDTVMALKQAVEVLMGQRGDDARSARYDELLAQTLRLDDSLVDIAATDADLAATDVDLAAADVVLADAIALKLNTSAYTAADVLTKLLTVDGAGSGLDADLLDGNSSAAFMLASLLTARGQIIRRGASAPEAVAAHTADTLLGGDGTDVGPRTAAQIKTTLSISTFFNTLLAAADAAELRALLGLEYGSWTPTVTAASGSFTTVSGSGIYIKWGRKLWVQITVTITTNGTAAGSVRATLPTANDSAAVLVGRENASTGSILQGFVTSTQVHIYDDDNLYPGGSGRSLIVSGDYRVAS